MRWARAGHLLFIIPHPYLSPPPTPINTPPPRTKQVQPQHPFFFAFMCLSALLFSLSDDHALLAMLSERSV